MIKRILQVWALSLFATGIAYSQDAPNMANASALSPNAAMADKASVSDINIFTGMPNVSIPLYAYAGKGLTLNISADYLGNIKDGESPSIIGMGWYLNTGGVVTRKVRSAPDDMATYGYLNAASIPTDFRSNGDKYYYDSLDAEPDLFEFNFNGRAGQFIISKTHQVVLTQQSKLKVEYTTDPTSKLIIAFKITTESGVKYLFNTGEFTSQTVAQGSNFFKSGYTGYHYYSAWYLTQIISPFNTDTIKLSYSTKPLNTTFAFPAVAFVKASDHSQTALYTADGTNYSNIIKLQNISFPDQTQVTFIYSNNYKYDDTDYALAKIKVTDTIFRKGFLFDYQTSYSGPIYKYDAAHDQEITSSATYATNLILKSITPYTAKEITKGYTFSYNVPYPNFHSYLQQDSVLNAYDYWGFFNGWQNRTTAIPFIPVINPSGANRASSPLRSSENTLSYVYLPGGGNTHYEYEPNTVSPYSPDPHSFTVNSSTATSTNTITLSQVFSPVHQLVFTWAGPATRTGSAPLSGTCNLVCNIKNTNGDTLFSTITFSLYDLFYEGIKTWTFNVPNRTYKIETSLTGGGTITGSFPFTVSWTNKLTGTSNLSTGGLRVHRITTQPATGDSIHAVIQEYKYTREDGKSSGFLGDVPQFYYPFQQIITSTGITTNLYGVSSDPVNSSNSVQGSLIGYSRVEVYKGTSSANLGKTVYEFTDLADVGTNYFNTGFPYAPQDIKDWGLGLPQRISVYDSSDVLLERKTNTYSFSSSTNTGSDFKGLKLGCSATTYATDPNTFPTTSRTNTYIGQEYYPVSGRADLINSADTIYHDDGSIQASGTGYTYDSYYNVSKITTSYDRNRNLVLETRNYYPYNYTLTSGAIKNLKDSNIITPVISTEKWITGDANPRLIGASITDFQKLSSNYIVPSDVYVLQTNQPLSQSTIGSFNSSQLVRNATYFKKQQSFTAYDNNGNALQATNDVSGENNTGLFDYGNNYMVAKVSNAAFGDVAYTSFESDGAGNWTIASSLRDKTGAITGKQSYDLSNGTISKSGLTSTVTYIVSGWAKPGATISVNGTNVTSLITASHNGWNFYSQSIGGITSITISGNGLIDEVRLYPKDANMLTYTYEPNVGVTSTCDANNTVIYTEYDNLNRTKLIKDNDKNILKKYDYSDSVFSISTLPQWIGSGVICEHLTGLAKYDSVYTDQNPYSDSYKGTMQVFKGTDYCMCTTDPSYKIVNGSCEEALIIITSSSHNKDGTYTCHWHYKWSDNSTLPVGSDYITNQSTPCGVVE